MTSDCLKNLHHQAVSVFEVIALDFAADRVIGFLLSQAERVWREKIGGAARLVEINVSAYAPRIQQTLGELGFVPVAYIPALAELGSERLDVVKMFRVAATVRINKEGLALQSRAVAELVLSGFERSKGITL